MYVAYPLKHENSPRTREPGNNRRQEQKSLGPSGKASLLLSLQPVFDLLHEHAAVSPQRKVLEKINVLCRQAPPVYCALPEFPKLLTG
jgi:hypothetical protein